MTFDAIRFLKENNIPHSTDSKHSTAEWVQVQYCPFCNSGNYHLGIHQTDGGVNCWKCGAHPLRDTIKMLLNCTWGGVNFAINIYSRIRNIQTSIQRHMEARELKDISWPPGTIELNDKHKSYLESRNYDPELLQRQWNLKGTSIIGAYKMRIIAPITYKNIMVSYQGRDITGKAYLRYKACLKGLESRPHKDCLYGLDKVTGKSVVVVEGITSAWRLGINTVATFGTAWTMAQASLLLGMDRVFLLYDMEERAQLQAEKLALLLSNSVKHVEVVNLKLEEGKDPADLSNSDAQSLMRQLIGRGK